MSDEKVPTTTGFRRDFAERLPLLDGIPAPSLTAPETAEQQARHAEWGAPFGPAGLPDDVEVDDVELVGPLGPIPARVYRTPSASGEARPGLVWFHGGAFMFGDLDMPEADHFSRQVAHQADAVVVSVFYRLAGDGVTFPVPQDDCWAAYTQVRQRAAEFGIDPARLAVGGASAGGNLAAGVSLHARDAGVPPWQALLAYPLVHPTLPDANAELSSKLEQTPPALRFPPEFNEHLNTLLCRGSIENATAYEYPGLSRDLTGFPPTFIENSEFDDLRASGEAFGHALEDAGVDVEMTTMAGAPHGHLNYVGTQTAREAYANFAARMRRA